MTLSTATPTRPRPSSSPEPRSGRTLARVGTGAAVVAGVAITAAGFLDPGYSQLGEGISALASRESGAAPVMTVGFAACQAQSWAQSRPP